MQGSLSLTVLRDNRPKNQLYNFKRETFKMVTVKLIKRDNHICQRCWTRKLKNIKLDDLKHVCTFSEGGYSQVSLVQLRGHPESAFALKTLQKAKISKPSSRQNVLSEKRILSEVESDFIVKFYRTFKNNKYLHLVTEYLPGGDLFNRGRFTEDVARFYIACVVEAFECLHSQNIAHNDLKPSNVVLDAEGYAKLVDFGLSQKLQPDEMAYSYGGTPAYLPPEVNVPLVEAGKIHTGRDRAVDLWALGILLYELLKGQNPFNTDGDEQTTRENITKGIGSIQFSRAYFSKQAEDFIRKLCAYASVCRLGYENINEMRQHRWFEGFKWTKLRKRKLRPPIVPNLDSPVDTQNFRRKVKSNLDSVEDESDWDIEF